MAISPNERSRSKQIQADLSRSKQIQRKSDANPTQILLQRDVIHRTQWQSQECAKENSARQLEGRPLAKSESESRSAAMPHLAVLRKSMRIRAYPCASGRIQAPVNPGGRECGDFTQHRTQNEAYPSISKHIQAYPSISYANPTQIQLHVT